MADVRLSIAGREYIVTCKDGEEPRLRALGAMVDEKAREAGGPSGGLNESRLLLFAALLLADTLHDGTVMGAPTETVEQSAEVDQAAETLERLADRLENLALRLEELAQPRYIEHGGTARYELMRTSLRRLFI